MSVYGVGIDTSCLICDRSENGENPYFVKELQTGYVVLGDHQHFRGYTLFLCKAHVSELYELGRNAKVKLLEEMSIVSKAVAKGFDTEK